jgi:hypothetical protein
MGQFFFLINIDKEKNVGLCIVTRIFDMDMTAYLCDPNEQNSWAEDRLILLGDYISNIPAGLGDEENQKDLFVMFMSGGDSESEDDNHHEECRYDKTSILHNLCTHEYIRADLFPG